ncbi:hypothetical protein FEM03_05545 [Phragmitibacter flavus]|uniref:RES domain-containing protein n=1 Tax=Phragmitibacter flavus TaxID=2576071 RepID=A0A5R8KH22_9BACT|nr:RES domain-containing protein [Phragmitibacter flavus]TLD71606.1 hypothetical protein FEM03_05545 [Phragmitibacter flavus]
MTRPNPEFSKFYQALSNANAFTSWNGNVVRQTAPRWMARPYRFTGAGAVHSGGRWTVQRLMPSVYASTDPITLNEELYYKGTRYGFTDADFKAQLRAGMHWELQAVLDLTQPTILDLLGVSHTQIVSCNWEDAQKSGIEPITQAIARAAFEHLVEGLVVPSARRRNGVNVVYFPCHRRDGSLIQTLDEANIPFVHGL